MIKVAFCCTYPIENLLPELVVDRDEIESWPSPWTVMLSQELAKYGNLELHVVTVTSLVPYNQMVKKNGITFHILKASLPLWLTKVLRLPEESTLLINPIWKMIKALKSIQPDIVHGHGTEGPFALAALSAGFPAVISIQGIMEYIYAAMPSRRSQLLRHLERYAVRKARFINVKSSLSQEFISKINPRAHQYFIEPPINDVFWANDKVKFAYSLFFIGSLLKRKGIEEWLETFARLKKRVPQLKGYIVGSGEASYVNALRNEYAMFVDSGDLQFLGQMNQQHIAAMYRMGGILLLASHVENSPNSVMEAMAAQLPVVATKVGALASMVSDHENGLLVDNKDVEQMVAAVSSLLNNPRLYMQCSSKGRETARRRWKPDLIAEQHIKMYEDILHRAD